MRLASLRPWAGAVAAALLLSQMAAAQDKPRIVVLATGGTIAGAAQSDVQAKYTSGQVGVPLRGLVGAVQYGVATFYRGAVGRHTTESEFSLDGVTALPRVDIVMAYENMDGKLIDAAVAAGAKGIVIAGVGNGNMTAAALAAQAKKGIVCVRSTRVATGRVGRNVGVDDDKLGLVVSDDLNPQKARVLLRLALLKQRPLADHQRLLEQY